MPTARRKTTRKQPQRGPAAKAGEASLKRLNSSLDTAHDALTELRKNLGRGGHEVVKDVQKRIIEVRKDARKLNKSLLSELDQLQKSIAGARSRSTRSNRVSSRKAATSRKATSTRKPSTRKPASARRKTAARSTAKRSTTSARSKRSTSARKS